MNVNPPRKWAMVCLVAAVAFAAAQAFAAGGGGGQGGGGRQRNAQNLQNMDPAAIQDLIQQRIGQLPPDTQARIQQGLQQLQQGMQQAQGQPQQQQRQALDQYKTLLGASDEEWTVLAPMIQKVLDARQVAITGWGTGAGNRAGMQNITQNLTVIINGLAAGPGGAAANPAPAPAATPANPVAAAIQQLKDALADAASPNDLVSQRIDAVHKAREQAQAELVAAQKALTEVLNVRQEGQLLAVGVLQ